MNHSSRQHGFLVAKGKHICKLGLAGRDLQSHTGLELMGGSGFPSLLCRVRFVGSGKHFFALVLAGSSCGLNSRSFLCFTFSSQGEEKEEEEEEEEEEDRTHYTLPKVSPLNNHQRCRSRQHFFFTTFFHVFKYDSPPHLLSSFYRSTLTL